MKVLAIGATGFIGPHVVRQLVTQGHHVAVLHRGVTSAERLEGVHDIRGDRALLSELRAELEGYAPEVVLDIVPYTERHARELVRAFCGVAGRLVAISSADVYRNYDGLRRLSICPPDPVPLSEDAPLRETLHPYRGHGMPFEHRDEYEKILVERVVLGEPALPGTVLRLPAVFGPRDKQHRLRPYLRPMDDGRPAVLLSEEQAGWRWTRGYVENVAAAIALAVADRRAAGRVFNVGDEPTMTEREWVERIAAVVHWRGDIVSVPGECLPRHLQQPFDWRYDLAIDTGRIREELGYAEPVPSHTALDRTVEWERSQPADGAPPDYSAEDIALERATPRN